MVPTFDDLIPPLAPNFDDLIPAPQAYAAQAEAVDFDDLIPNQDAPWPPSYSGAAPLNSGHPFVNDVAAGTIQDSHPAPAQSVLPPIGQQDAAYLQAKWGSYPNVGYGLSVPSHDEAAAASTPTPLSSTDHLPATTAFALFHAPMSLRPDGSVVSEPVGSQLSPPVRSYLLPPGTPVDALGNPSPVTLISPDAGNMTIDTYPGEISIFPPVPAPLLTLGASVRSQLDNAGQASYLVSANGSSASYSPLTFLAGAIGIASAKPGDTWGGVPLAANDIAAAQRFIAWAETPFVSQNPYLDQIWNGYGFEPNHSGLDQAQRVFAAEKSALDKQYGWMALPAMLPLAIAAAPTLASGLNTVGAWAGSQASVWAPRVAGGLGLAGAAAVQREEESAPSVGEGLGVIAARDATKAAEGESSVTQLGGAYRDVKGILGYEAHHMPADSASPLATGEGPSIALLEEDHQVTASRGNSAEARAYRQLLADLINQGDFRRAQQLDILDVQAKLGNKYDDANQQMLKYSRDKGHW